MAKTRWNEEGKVWVDDPWLDDDELAGLEKADVAETFRGPVPTQLVSNGEVSPIPQTPQQRRVETRVKDLVAAAADRLCVDRRAFLRGAGAVAASFLAMNEVFGEHFAVEAAELYEPGAGRPLPKDVFVFDDQLHLVRGSAFVPVGPVLRAFAQGPSSRFPQNPLNAKNVPDEKGNAWTVLNPALAGLPITPEAFQLTQFIKDVWLDSQTHVGMISNAPTAAGMAFEPRNVEEALQGMLLSADQGAAARDFINEVAGSKRCLFHGHLFLGKPNLSWMEYQLENNEPDSWKGYNIAAHAKEDAKSVMKVWRHDDEKVAYPTWEFIERHARRLAATKPGLRNICVHKGLAPGLPPIPESGHPGDLPKAARDFPHLNFITYHAAYLPVFAGDTVAEVAGGKKTREGVPDISWTTLYGQLVQDLPNCYAEIGATFGMTAVTFPTVCAHILGQLVKYLGEDRILWGSDSVWWGSPQWQIEAFWRFQIPAELQKKHGYPPLTETTKRKILGLNAARLFGVSPDVRRYTAMPPGYASRIPDDLKRILDFPAHERDQPPQPGQPGGIYGGHKRASLAPETDGLGGIKRRYEELGTSPSHTRYGWIVPPRG